MTFLRVVFLLLLVINLLLGVANLTGFAHAPGGEPERLANQLHPEKLHLLPAGTVTAKPIKLEVAKPETPKAEPSKPAPEPATPTSNNVAEAPKPAPAPQDSAPHAEAALPTACVSWSGLSRTQADPIKNRARNAKFTLREHISGAATWWVHLPPQADRDAAEKKAGELQAMGVKDFFVIKDPGPSENAISLGLYKNELSAKRMLEQLKAQGVQSARITIRESPTSTVRLEVSGAADLLAGFASETAANLPIGIARGSCTPER